MRGSFSLRLWIFGLVLGAWVTPLLAQDWLDLEERTRFGAPNAPVTLRIISNTDTVIIRHVLEKFVAQAPLIGVDYMVAGSTNLNRAIKADPSQFDIAISSAMDLQFKLANDGFTRALPDLGHPEWATWRNSLFGFTQEPAVILIRKAAFDGLVLPTTRQELITTLRQNPDRFTGKVGTYDIRRAGLGYLFATQDARASETYWRLMEVLGTLDVQLYCCSGDMIDGLLSGELAVAYNVIGSYVTARADARRDVVAIDPQDFQTRIMRTALVLDSTKHEPQARQFMQFLLNGRWRDAEQDADVLPPLPRGLGSETSPQGLIRLDPGLLTYLDQLKRRKFTREWQDALVQR